MAVTVKVYTATSNPGTVIGLLVPLTRMSPGLEMTVYSVMLAPPMSEGALKYTAADEVPAPTPVKVTINDVGAAGTDRAVTLAEAEEETLLPISVIATAWNVYETPLLKPDTTIGLELPLAENELGLDVTKYEEIMASPVFEGTSNDTLIDAVTLLISLTTATTLVGGSDRSNTDE
jgi:hypothetical protein